MRHEIGLASAWAENAGKEHVLREPSFASTFGLSISAPAFKTNRVTAILSVDAVNQVVRVVYVDSLLSTSILTICSFIGPADGGTGSSRLASHLAELLVGNSVEEVFAVGDVPGVGGLHARMLKTSRLGRGTESG